MAVASLSTLIKHSNSCIDILAGNLFSLELNDNSVVDQLDDFLKRGGSLRVLMYNYSYDGLLSSPLFRMLAVRSKRGCKVMVSTMESPGKIEVNGIEKRCNLFVFDYINSRVEYAPNWTKGIISIMDKQGAHTIVELIKRYEQSHDVHPIDLLDSFKLK